MEHTTQDILSSVYERISALYGCLRVRSTLMVEDPADPTSIQPVAGILEDGVYKLWVKDGGGGGGGGDASAANQTLQLIQETIIAGKTTSIDNKTPVVGQKAMVGSVPVVIANNQSTIPVTFSASTITSYIISGPAIAAATTVALVAKVNRLHAILTNISDEIIFVAEGIPAVMNQGIPIFPNGGSYEINKNNLFTGAINAICASGGKILCITEGV